MFLGGFIVFMAFIFVSLQCNMSSYYGCSWKKEAKEKLKTMESPQSHFLVVPTNTTLLKDATQPYNFNKFGGFIQFQFVFEEGLPVAYVFEVQILPSLRGNGLGSIFMEEIEKFGENVSFGVPFFNHSFLSPFLFLYPTYFHSFCVRLLIDRSTKKNHICSFFRMEWLELP